MNKKKVLIIVGMIILLAIIGIILIAKNHKKELFIHSFSNYNKYGYIIYDDGTIKEYNETEKKKLKKNKLTKDELEELKTLANKVEDDFYVLEGATFFDAGTTIDKIYSDKINDWIIIFKRDYYYGYNNTEEGRRIRELVNELYEKYIKDDQ